MVWGLTRCRVIQLPFREICAGRGVLIAGHVRDGGDEMARGMEVGTSDIRDPVIAGSVSSVSSVRRSLAPFDDQVLYLVDDCR